MDNIIEIISYIQSKYLNDEIIIIESFFYETVNYYLKNWKIRPHLLKLLTTLICEHDKNNTSILNIKKACGCITYFDPDILVNQDQMMYIIFENNAVVHFKLCVDKSKSKLGYHKSELYNSVIEDIISYFNKYVNFIYLLEERNLTFDDKDKIEVLFENLKPIYNIDSYSDLNKNSGSFLKKKEMLLYLTNRCYRDFGIYGKFPKRLLKIYKNNRIIRFYKRLFVNIKKALHLLEICKSGDF